MDDWLLVLIPVAVFLVGLGLFALWVWSMVSAAKNGKWVWFVLILIFSPLCLLYLLFADKRPAASSGPPRVRREPI